MAILLFASQVMVAKGQWAGDKDPYLSKSLANETVKRVTAETSGGSVSVIGVNTSEARIEVYVTPSNGNANSLSKEEIQKRLEENYSLDISFNNQELNAVAKSKSWNLNWKKSLSISFKIYVPRQVETRLRTSGGSIRLTNLDGNQDFSTSGGSLHIDHVSGSIKGRTSGGSIHLADSKDEIDLSTSGGSIEASNSSGNIHLATSGGSLRLDQLSGKIDANTSGGSVEGADISGELKAFTSGGSIRLKGIKAGIETGTSGGSIKVEITELGKYVTVHNSGGDIDVELPSNKGLTLNVSARKIRVGTMHDFNGSTDERHLEGTISGGGTPVNISASSGSVGLSWK